MPEGPQVKRAGNMIASHIGHQLISIIHPASREPWGLDLPVLIKDVQTVGKNLFIHLESDQVIYNHMLMWGSWRAGCDVRKKRLNTCFKTSKGGLGYYGGGILKLIMATEATQLQSKLGPDIMTAKTAEAAFTKLRQSKLPIGEALLSQELVAGVGNIYKSEGLFAARLNPECRADQVTAVEYERLFRFLHAQMLADVKRAGAITTTTKELAASGTRNFVYRRMGQACVLCGTKIKRIYQGKNLPRSTYFCPQCQS